MTRSQILVVMLVVSVCLAKASLGESSQSSRSILAVDSVLSHADALIGLRMETFIELSRFMSTRTCQGRSGIPFLRSLLILQAIVAGTRRCANPRPRPSTSKVLRPLPNIAPVLVVPL